MNPLWWIRTAVVAVVVLASLGCATGRHHGMMAASGNVKGENNDCSWTIDKAADGKVLAGSLQITNKSSQGCTPYNSGNKLYVGDSPSKGSEIIYIGPVEFVTKGSPCRRCYLNTYGGMTCITYPGPC